MTQTSPRSFRTFFVATFTLLLMAGTLHAQGPLMRFPDIHEDLIVFVHGEDIWSVPSEGGVATRLTIHDGQERFPKFSNDGALIAFTAEYDGNTDVYVMNRYGGDITRVTWHPGNDEVVGWHPEKNKILFMSSRSNFPRLTQLYLINPDGTGLEKLIFHEASNGTYSPDGKRFAYNKTSREFRTWKRYKGGRAQEIYLYDFETDEEKNLTNFEGTDRIPMWWGDKIYFSSDRDRVLNIYSVDPADGQIEQLTSHTAYDVRRPSIGGNKIIYELGGTLRVLDLEDGQTHQVDVQILSDAPELRPYFKNVKGDLTEIGSSPDGKTALLVARGEIFTVALNDSTTINHTRSSGVHERGAVWSPDGRKIAYFSDESGEYEIYVANMDGDRKAVRMTTHKDGYRHTLRWSPDSKKLAYTDQTLTLYILDTETKKTTRVDKSEYENIDVSLHLKPIYDFNWSPDSRYIAYTKMDADLVYKIYIYDLADKHIQQVSTHYNDFNPVFSKDGNYLFFISNRRFNPTFGDFEWEMVFKDVAGVYCAALRKDVPSIHTGQAEKAGQIKIEYEGLPERIEALNLPSGNYRNLVLTETGAIYMNRDDGDFNRFEFRLPPDMDLYFYSFKDKKEKPLIKKINDFKLSADGSRIVFRKSGSVGSIQLSDPQFKSEHFSLSDLSMWFVPMEEWKQIYDEAWRMERDFYYEPNMHGLDWDAMKEKYGVLVDHAVCRQDMRFIIGELIGELNTSHTYVSGGDFKRQAQPVSVGMLGVDYEADADANRYKITRIYKDFDWSREIMPPLAKPGINIEEGDYLISVNGEQVTTDRNVYAYFQNLGGKEIEIEVSSLKEGSDVRKYKVTTLRSESGLRYSYWIEENRRKVDELSDGRIGYLHFPDTYFGSAVNFPRQFYSQARKEGLIIDGRSNGGGLDPDIFFRRFRRAPHSYWTRRYSHDQTSPVYGVRAYMVCLTNRQAGSGGDEFPEEFQQFNMGPVIGTRTWGGLVGISMFLSMIDGGGLTAPDYRIYDENGKWIVENEGVTPDIILDNKPAEMARGYDAQLMKGVEILMKKIEEEPIVWPEHEPFPVDN
jgi:tricorn protease